tara:strand:- start:1507 stop:2349 length:843 start_codon:yes stop_codon:yes gene_type:complete
MEQLKKYIKLNGKYINMIPNTTGINNTYTSSLSVIYNNNYYCEIKLVDDDISDHFEELIDKLEKKIILDVGKKGIIDSFSKTQYIILHRGNHVDFTENSLKALDFACEHYDGFETDIRLTKDSYWVVNHDSDCLRIHNKDFILKQTSLIDILLETNIVRFKKLLFTNNYVNKFINIEIKEKYSECNNISKISLINTLLKFNNKLLVSSFDWHWFEFIDSYNLDFAHLILDINKLPKKFNKIIISKYDYQDIILKKNNLPIYGVWGTKKKFNFVDLTIIDL